MTIFRWYVVYCQRRLCGSESAQRAAVPRSNPDLQGDKSVGVIITNFNFAQRSQLIQRECLGSIQRLESHLSLGRSYP